MILLTAAAIIAAVVAWRRGEPMMLGQRLRRIWEFFWIKWVLQVEAVTFAILVFVTIFISFWGAPFR